MSTLLMVCFLVAAFTAFVGALMLVFHSRPMAAALGMVLSMTAFGVLYAMLHVPFLGLFQIIVYAGAVMVMVLFIIMSLDAKEEGPEVGGLQTFTAYVAGLGLIAFLMLTVRKSSLGVFPSVEKTFGSIKSFGHLLVGNYAVPFELASLLLVGAMVGAIVISRRRWQ